jgi:cell wall assembly regulator SMI1
MEETWFRILKFWEKFPTVSIAGLGPPATIEQIRQTEIKIGKTFPVDFVDFYRIHNGWRDLVMPGASMLLSLEGIIDSASVVANRQEDDFTLLIPFTKSSRNRDFYCLNFSDEAYGSIVFISTDVPESYSVATSFLEWINRYAENPGFMD